MLTKELEERIRQIVTEVVQQYVPGARDAVVAFFATTANEAALGLKEIEASDYSTLDELKES